MAHCNIMIRICIQCRYHTEEMTISSIGEGSQIIIHITNISIKSTICKFSSDWINIKRCNTLGNCNFCISLTSTNIPFSDFIIQTSRVQNFLIGWMKNHSFDLIMMPKSTNKTIVFYKPNLSTVISAS